MRVTIVDTVTGERRTTDAAFEFTAFWWSEGNGACDCNRAILFGVDAELDAAQHRQHPHLLPHQSLCLGCTRFLIVATDDETISLHDLNADYPADLLARYLQG